MKNKLMENKCIICGKTTYPGKFFCIECYEKYKNKEIILKI